MAWERAGSVSINQGAHTVTGSGTLFTAKARVGDGFVDYNGILYEIENIVSDTVLRLATPYLGDSVENGKYVIIPVRGYQKLSADRLYKVTEDIQYVYDTVMGLPEWLTVDQLVPVGAGGTGARDAAAARKNLGLGSISIRDAGILVGQVERISEGVEKVDTVINEYEVEHKDAFGNVIDVETVTEEIHTVVTDLDEFKENLSYVLPEEYQNGPSKKVKYLTVFGKMQLAANDNYLAIRELGEAWVELYHSGNINRRVEKTESFDISGVDSLSTIVCQNSEPIEITLPSTIVLPRGGAYSCTVIRQDAEVRFVDDAGEPLADQYGTVGTSVGDLVAVVHDGTSWHIKTKTVTAVQNLEVRGEAVFKEDVTLEKDLEVQGNTSVAEDLTVGGNLYVKGNTSTVEAKNLEVEDTHILLNKGEQGAGVTHGSAGIEVDRGSEDNYKFEFDETDNSFKIGKEGSMQDVATRTGLKGGELVQWDAATKSLVPAVLAEGLGDDKKSVMSQDEVTKAIEALNAETLSLSAEDETSIKDELAKKFNSENIVGELGNSEVLVVNQKLVSEALASISSAASGGAIPLIKPIVYGPTFVKNGPTEVSVRAGTQVQVNGVWYTYSEETAVEFEDPIPGEDYAIFADENFTLHAIHDPFETPASPPTPLSVLIGGFHMGLTPADETLSEGQFATSGAGFHWNQLALEAIKGVNSFSFWDLKFRRKGIVNIPGNPRDGRHSNHGFAFDPYKNVFVAIYFLNSNPDVYGLSRAGSDVASHTNAVVIPRAFNGNGSNKYAARGGLGGPGNWWDLLEALSSQGARHPFEHEFNSFAFGTTEAKVLGGASTTIPATKREKGFTSRIGIEQVSGHHHIWGMDSNFRYNNTSYDWANVNGGRGQVYNQGSYGITRALFGGARAHSASSCGSRAVYWDLYPWGSHWSIGARAVDDLLVLS